LRCGENVDHVVFKTQLDYARPGAAENTGCGLFVHEYRCMAAPAKRRRERVTGAGREFRCYVSNHAFRLTSTNCIPIDATMSPMKRVTVACVPRPR